MKAKVKLVQIRIPLYIIRQLRREAGRRGIFLYRLIEERLRGQLPARAARPGKAAAARAVAAEAGQGAGVPDSLAGGANRGIK